MKYATCILLFFIKIYCVFSQSKTIFIIHTGIQDLSIMPIAVCCETFDTNFVEKSLRKRRPSHKLYVPITLEKNKFLIVDSIIRCLSPKNEPQKDSLFWGSFNISIFSQDHKKNFTARIYSADNSTKYLESISSKIIGAIGKNDLSEELTVIVKNMIWYEDLKRKNRKKL